MSQLNAERSHLFVNDMQFYTHSNTSSIMGFSVILSSCLICELHVIRTRPVDILF